jgi:DNA-binding transcriptional LysR family regulator
MSMSLSPTWLRTFVAVMEHRSFARAARALGYTTSAVSQQMVGLEHGLGLPLFERGTRSIAPMRSAIYLYEQTAELQALLSRMEVDVQRIAAGQAGRIRVGSFASAGVWLLPAIVARTLVKHRNIEVQLAEGEPSEMVPSVLLGEIDLALIFRYDLVPTALPREIAIAPVFTDPMTVIASRRYRLAKADAVSMAQLEQETWITTTADTGLHECLVICAAAAGYVPVVGLETNNYAALRGFVREGLGIAMVPKMSQVDDPEIIELPIVDRLPSRSIEAISRPLDDSPIVQLMRTAICAIAREVATGAARPKPH